MDEHSVVQRAYAFVEDMFGLEHAFGEPRRAIPDTTQEVGPASDHSNSADEYTYKTVAEISIERARRTDR
jgi:hypothetical protein